MIDKAYATLTRRRSRSFCSLLALLGILSIGGMRGGWQLMADPTGRWLAVSPELFNPWIPPDFFLPGLYVFVFFGITPLFLAYALLTDLRWPLAEMVVSRSGYHWAWFAAVGLATLLALWTMALLLMVGFQTLYQLLDALMSLLILWFLLRPSVRRAHNQS